MLTLRPRLLAALMWSVQCSSHYVSFSPVFVWVGTGHDGGRTGPPFTWTGLSSSSSSVPPSCPHSYLCISCFCTWTSMCFKEVSPLLPLSVSLPLPSAPPPGSAGSTVRSDALGVQTRRHPDDPPADPPARLQAPLAQAEPREPAAGLPHYFTNREKKRG